MADAPVIPLALTGIGLYLAWFGIHYWRSSITWPTTPLKSVLQGNGLPVPDKQIPAAQQLASDVASASATEATPVGVTAVGQPNTPGSTGSAIADDALKYVGHCYTFGGAPGPSGKGCWDCSSFVNWVLGHDMGMKIPGGLWAQVTNNGNSHGPTTLDYLLFGTAINTASVVAGDLVVYQTHMGIATDRDTMVSAEDPQQGTATSSIAGMTSSLGEIPFFRRVASLWLMLLSSPWP